jgi:hypothetical protein
MVVGRGYLGNPGPELFWVAFEDTPVSDNRASWPLAGEWGKGR